MRILLAAPGLVHRPGCGPTEHMWSLATAFARQPDVDLDLLFARIPHRVTSAVTSAVTRSEFGVLALGKNGGVGPADTLTLGLDPRGYAQHARECHRMAPALDRYDLLIERVWLGGGILAAKAAERGIPVILEENGPIRDGDRFDLMRRLALAIARRRLRKVYRRASAIVVQSAPLAMRLVDEYGVRSNGLHVIPNGIDCQAPTRPDPVDDTTRLVYAGALDPDHDLGPLLDALEAVGDRARDLEMHVFGVGETASRWESRGGGAVRLLFHEPVPSDQLAGVLQKMDLGLAPYGQGPIAGDGFEYSPLKILQYMACDLPVATMPQSGGPLVQPGQNGFLLDNTEEDWTALLNSLPPKEALRDMGRGNRAAVEHRSWDAVVERYLTIARNLVS